MTSWLELEDVLQLARDLGVGPVRDLGLLDSATLRPRSTAFGMDAYPTLEEQAGALLHSLARNHALVDGNKRLSWLATVVFLDINGSEPEITDDEAFALTMEVAQGVLEVPEIATRLRVRPSREPR